MSTTQKDKTPENQNALMFQGKIPFLLPKYAPPLNLEEIACIAALLTSVVPSPTSPESKWYEAGLLEITEKL